MTEQGFTTAGALDIFSIDKESAIPLLKGAVSMYREDKSEEWLVLAENAAWYLSTWQYSCTEKFSKETTLGKTGYDSFGGTLYRLCMKEWIHLHYLMCQSYMSWENKLVRQDGLKGQKQYGEMDVSMYQMER